MQKTFDFSTSVIQASHKKPVLVQFSAAGCGPCFWMEKTLIEITKKQKGAIHLVSILNQDVEEEVKQHNITNNPTTLLFIDGSEVARLRGALPLMVVEQWLTDHI